jgi:dihydrofolate reductase
MTDTRELDMKASVFIATSVDGFIARENGSIDWLPADGGASDGEDYGYVAFMDTVDVLVMGRHTFEKALTFGAWPYGKRSVVVLTSRTTGLPALPAETVEYMSGTPPEIVARLAARGAQHLYVDGGNAIMRFLEAGLVQRFIITRVPILLGRGIPLLGPTGCDITLRHVDTRAYPSGFVQSEYVVSAPSRR